MGKGGACGGTTTVLIALVIFLAVLVIAAIVIGIVALVRPASLDPSTSTRTITRVTEKSDKEKGSGGGGPSGSGSAQVLQSSSNDVIIINGGSSSSSSSSSSSYSKKGGAPILFAIDDDWLGYDFRNDDGSVSGFQKDFIYAICAEAELNCEIVVDDWRNCRNGSKPGRGLIERWYDACAGWGSNAEMLDYFDFSEPYIRAGTYYFFVKPGDTSFNVNDVRNKTIGFGTAYQENLRKCEELPSSTQGVPLSDTQMQSFDAEPALVESVLIGDIDAGFLPLYVIQKFLDEGIINTVGDGYLCYGHHGFMVRKDRKELLRVLNDAVREMTSSRQYDELCDRANDKYGSRGEVLCL